MSVVKNIVEKQIAESPVVVYSKSWCPYCRQTKATLAEFGASYQVYELDQIGTSPRPFPWLFSEPLPTSLERC